MFSLAFRHRIPFTFYYQDLIMSTVGPLLPLSLQLFSIRVESKSASLDPIFSPSLGKIFLLGSHGAFPSKLQDITTLNNDGGLCILGCKYTLSVEPWDVLINCIFWNSICVLCLLYSHIKRVTAITFPQKLCEERGLCLPSVIYI